MTASKHIVSQEPAYMAQLREVNNRLDKVDLRLEKVVVHHEGAPDSTTLLGTTWQDWPEMPGVRVLHVPHPAGKAGLFLAVCHVPPGAKSSGAYMDESRLIAMLDGEMAAGGKAYKKGEFLWIAPGQPMDWSTEGGYLGVVVYDAAPHDIDPDLLPPVSIL